MAGIIDITSNSIPTTASTGVSTPCGFVATVTGGDCLDGLMAIALLKGPASVVLTDANGNTLSMDPCVCSGNTCQCSSVVAWTPNANPVPNGTVFNINFSMTMPTAGQYIFALMTAHHTGNNIDTVWKQVNVTMTVSDSSSNPVFHITNVAPQAPVKKGETLQVIVQASCNVNAPRNPVVTLQALDSAGALVGTGTGTVIMTGQTTGTVTIPVAISSGTQLGAGTICPSIQ